MLYGAGLAILHGLSLIGCSDRQPFECGNFAPKITADGRELVYQRFFCEATGILSTRVVGVHLLAYDEETGKTARLSTAVISTFDISDDGNIIVYQPEGTTLAIHDRTSNRANTLDVANLGRGFLVPSTPAISGDGQVVAFTILLKDNGEAIFLYDRAAERVERATAVFRAIRPSLSTDGRFMAFQTDTDLQGSGTPAIYVQDRETKETTLVSVNSSGQPAAGSSFEPVISGNGRFVVYRSSATNLVAPSVMLGSAEVYLHDCETGETTLVSRAADSGDPSGTRGWLGQPAHGISADGRFIVYESESNTVAPINEGTTVPVQNIYLYDRQTGVSTRVSISSSGEAANRFSTAPSISDDGGLVTFTTNAGNFVSDDTDLDNDVYLRDVRAGETTWVSRR
jgi:Tol biopolymer transport system component